MLCKIALCRKAFFTSITVPSRQIQNGGCQLGWHPLLKNWTVFFILHFTQQCIGSKFMLHLIWFVCSDVLADGGNAVDAAIATVFCIGAVNPQSAGIGGGFFMTIYDPVERQTRCLNAREVAPINAHEDMFKGNSSISQRGLHFSYFH